MTYIRTGAFARAVERSALDIQRRHGHSAEVVTGLDTLGLAYAGHGDRDRAVET